MAYRGTRAALSLVLLVAGLAAAAHADWESSPPEELRMDSGWLEAMTAVIEAIDLPIDSIVVARHGRIAFEYYPRPLYYGPNGRHVLYSATKSVTSTLIGIAIEQGLIESVDAKVVDFFPDRTIAHLDDRKRSMTVEHLLTMTSGFDWTGPDDAHHSWGEAIRSGDPVQYTLDRPVIHEPGTVWYYNGGCSHLLSAILTEVSGTSTLRFANEVLFGPLGITNVRWPRDPNAIYYGGQDIWMSTRSMAKLGQGLAPAVQQHPANPPAARLRRQARQVRLAHGADEHDVRSRGLLLREDFADLRSLPLRIVVGGKGAQ